MKFDFSTNLWDGTKSVALILVIVFMFLKVPTMFDSALNTLSTNKVDETTITRVAENLVRVQLVESNKELKALIKEMKDMNSATLQMIKEKDEQIVELGKVIGSMGGNSASSSGSVVHSNSEEPTKELEDVVVYSKVADDKEIPVARVFYSPNAPEGTDKWGSQTFPIDYYTTIFETKDVEGNSNRYVELWAQNDFIPSTRGKKFPINISEVKWAKGKEPDKKFRFHTRLGFSGIFSTKELYPALDISFLSYGRTKRDMEWRFLDITLGGTKEDLYFGVIPASYNLGNIIPFVENTFIGPSIAVDTELNYSYGISLSVPF